MLINYGFTLYGIYYQTRLREFKALYDDKARFDATIDRHTRSFCKSLYKSELGVSIYSCHGHNTKVDPCPGYVMSVSETRYDSNQLVEIYQKVSADLIATLGWEAIPNIECSVGWMNDEECYPCVVFRSPYFEKATARNIWWAVANKSFKKYAGVTK